MAWSTLDIGAYKQAEGGPASHTSSGVLTAAIATTAGIAEIVKTATGVLTAAVATTTGEATTEGVSSLNNTRISAMHFQKHYEPTAVGE